MNEELKHKISELKDLTSQLEYSWGAKYNNMIREKE